MILPFQKKERFKSVDCEPIMEVSKHIHDITATHSKAAQKSKGLLHSLFCNRTERAVIRGEMRMIEEQYESFQAAQKLMSEAQRERLCELQYQFLMKERIQGRMKVTEELLAGQTDLSKRLRHLTHAHIQQLTEDLQNTTLIPDEQSRKAYTEQVRDEFVSFLDMQKRILDAANQMIRFVLSAP